MRYYITFLNIVNKHSFLRAPWRTVYFHLRQHSGTIHKKKVNSVSVTTRKCVKNTPAVLSVAPSAVSKCTAHAERWAEIHFPCCPRCEQSSCRNRGCVCRSLSIWSITVSTTTRFHLVNPCKNLTVIKAYCGFTGACVPDYFLAGSTDFLESEPVAWQRNCEVTWLLAFYFSITSVPNISDERKLMSMRLFEAF